MHRSLAQQVHLSGTIVADNGQPVRGAYLKVNGKGKAYILAYVNTGDTNTFQISFPFYGPDTILVTISHTRFSTSTKTLWVDTAGSYTLQALLPLAGKHWDTVTVKAPPVWVRGDTTFYNVDAFKEGDERKLKDLLVKMPGFEFDENGTLLFKRKPVEKVTIEGEEIFADKVRLMVNNFPVHVLKTIQALENQSGNQLLKGLANDGKVFVNLALNNAKLKTAFGDGEAGVGTRGRYFVNPVVFAMAGRLKGGIIGNYNSIGQGLDWSEDTRPETEQQSQQWMMQPNTLQRINNFSVSRYVTNQQWDTRVDLNRPFGKGVQGKTEMAFVADRQLQNTFYTSSLLSADSFINRQESFERLNRPLLLNIQQTFSHNTGNTKGWKAQVRYWYNGSVGRLQAIYLQQGVATAAYNNLHNRWHGMEASFNATHRTSATLATEWQVQIANHPYQQQAQSISGQYGSFFNVADSAYNLLLQQLNNRLGYGQAWYQWLSKRKGRLQTTRLELNYQQANVQPVLQLADAELNKPLERVSPFSQSGRFGVVTAQMIHKQDVSMGKYPLQVQVSGGLAHTTFRQLASHAATTNGIFAGEISKKHSLTKRISAGGTLAVRQQALPLYQRPAFYLPATFNSFSRYTTTGQTTRQLNAFYTLGYFYPRSLSNTNLNVSFASTKGVFAPQSTFNGFVQLLTDTFLNRTQNQFMLFSTSTVSVIRDKLVITGGGGYSRSTNFYLVGDNAANGSINLVFAHVNVRANMHKVYFAQVETHWSQSGFNLPGILAKNVANNVSNMRLHINQRLVVKKQLSLLLNTSYYKNNMGSTNAASFLLADAEAVYNLPGKPFTFSLKADNLTNQTYFFTYNNQPLLQSFYSVPLIGRNVLLSLRYQL